MSRRTKQWCKIARQANQNHRAGNVGHLIPHERCVSKSTRIITEPASPEKRALMIEAMTTSREKSRR